MIFYGYGYRSLGYRIYAFASIRAYKRYVIVCCYCVIIYCAAYCVSSCVYPCSLAQRYYLAKLFFADKLSASYLCRQRKHLFAVYARLILYAYGYRSLGYRIYAFASIRAYKRYVIVCCYCVIIYCAAYCVSSCVYPCSLAQRYYLAKLFFADKLSASYLCRQRKHLFAVYARLILYAYGYRSFRYLQNGGIFLIQNIP